MSSGVTKGILYDTYHGVFVSIQYKPKCEPKRHFLTKGVGIEVGYFVEQRVSSVTQYFQFYIIRVRHSFSLLIQNKRDTVKDQALLKRMNNSVVKFIITPTLWCAISRTKIPIPLFSFSWNDTCDHMRYCLAIYQRGTYINESRRYHHFFRSPYQKKEKSCQEVKIKSSLLLCTVPTVHYVCIASNLRNQTFCKIL